MNCHHTDIFILEWSYLQSRVRIHSNIKVLVDDSIASDLNDWKESLKHLEDKFDLK
jgi:hypothetical protein